MFAIGINVVSKNINRHNEMNIKQLAQFAFGQENESGGCTLICCEGLEDRCVDWVSSITGESVWSRLCNDPEAPC